MEFFNRLLPLNVASNNKDPYIPGYDQNREAYFFTNKSTRIFFIIFTVFYPNTDDFQNFLIVI